LPFRGAQCIQVERDTPFNKDSNQSAVVYATNVARGLMVEDIPTPIRDAGVKISISSKFTIYFRPWSKGPNVYTAGAKNRSRQSYK